MTLSAGNAASAGGAAGTKARLMTAALDVVRDQGLAAASARTIATRAEVNQALIFYHFGTVTELIEAASNDAVLARVAHYREDFAAVSSLPGLLAIGRRVHEEERREGTIAIMAQLMAGAQHDPVLARATRHAIGLWTAQIREALDRVLSATPVGTLLDTEGLAQVISAAFIGIELQDGADPDGPSKAFATIEQLGDLITTLNDLGPLTQTALRVEIGRASWRERV